MIITLSITDIIVSLICIILILLGSIYGDSSKKTAWMFFLSPVGLIVLIFYWISVLVNFL